MEVKGTKINLKRKRCLLTPLLAVSLTAEGLAILLLVFNRSNYFAGLRSLAWTHNRRSSGFWEECYCRSLIVFIMRYANIGEDLYLQLHNYLTSI